MTTWLKRGGSWTPYSTGSQWRVKVAGVWKIRSTLVRMSYVKRSGAWKNETAGTLAAGFTQHRRYQLAFPGTLTAQASTVDSVQDRMDETVLEVAAYSLPGDGSIIVDLVGTQATATAMTNAVKAALEPWSTVTSLGSIP